MQKPNPVIKNYIYSSEPFIIEEIKEHSAENVLINFEHSSVKILFNHEKSDMFRLLQFTD